jgi:hypothetical protein
MAFKACQIQEQWVWKDMKWLKQALSSQNLIALYKGKQVFNTMHFNIRIQFRIGNGNGFKNVNDLLFWSFEEIWC